MEYFVEQSRDDFLSSDDKRAMRVESTLARILRAANDVGFMKPPLEIILIDNAAPLTGTISDDRLFLTTGLLDQCHTGDELAGILGHQVAHWCCDGEVSDRQIRLAGVPGSICRSVYLPQYDPRPLVNLSDAKSGPFQELRDFEMAMDALGAVTVMKAGFEPRPLRHVLRRIQEQKQANGSDFMTGCTEKLPVIKDGKPRLEMFGHAQNAHPEVYCMWPRGIHDDRVGRIEDNLLSRDQPSISEALKMLDSRRLCGNPIKAAPGQRAGDSSKIPSVKNAPDSPVPDTALQSKRWVQEPPASSTDKRITSVWSHDPKSLRSSSSERREAFPKSERRSLSKSEGHRERKEEDGDDVMTARLESTKARHVNSPEPGANKTFESEGEPKLELAMRALSSVYIPFRLWEQV